MSFRWMAGMGRSPESTDLRHLWHPQAAALGRQSVLRIEPATTRDLTPHSHHRATSKVGHLY